MGHYFSTALMFARFHEIIIIFSPDECSRSYKTLNILPAKTKTYTVHIYILTILDDIYGCIFTYICSIEHFLQILFLPTDNGGTHRHTHAAA